MPGSLFNFQCPGCNASLEMTTGTGVHPDTRVAWTYEQFICPACETIESRASPDVWGDGRACERCQSELLPWAGRVWHERDPEGHVGAERLEGPCPRCSTTITIANATMRGAWD